MGEEENSLYILKNRLSFLSFLFLDLNHQSVRMLKLEAIFQFLCKLLPKFNEI